MPACSDPLQAFERGALQDTCWSGTHGEACCSRSSEAAACLDRYAELLREHQPNLSAECQASLRVPALCRSARVFLGSQKRTANATSTWQRWMQSLASNLKINCESIHDMRRRWQPAVFLWPEMGWTNRVEVRLISNSVAWQGTWLTVLNHSTYGPRGVKSYPLPPCAGCLAAKTQLDRVQHAWVFFAMERVTGLKLEELGLVLEFGAGTGQMAHVLQVLPSFQGLHLTFDVPAMLLMQRYWCREAGVPAQIVGYDLSVEALVAATQRFTRRRLAQMHSASDVARFLRNRRHRAPVAETPPSPADDDAMFVATYSFTEADLGTREHFVRLTRDFGRLYLMFAKVKWDGIDNVGYLGKWISASLKHTHRICTWAHGARAFQLAAVRRDLGVPARCGQAVGCSNQSVNYEMSFDCEFDTPSSE